MIAEVATRYPGLGRPIEEIAWGLFLELAHRCARFEAREQLGILDGVRSAIGAAFSSDADTRDVEEARERLVELAHPVKRQRTQTILDADGKPWGSDG